MLELLKVLHSIGSLLHLVTFEYTIQTGRFNALGIPLLDLHQATANVFVDGGWGTLFLHFHLPLNILHFLLEVERLFVRASLLKH